MKTLERDEGIRMIGNAPVRSYWVVEVYRHDGPDGYRRPAFREERCNLTPNVGSNWLASRIGSANQAGSTASAMAYMAVGTGSTGPTVTNTMLGGEVRRLAFAVNEVTSTNVWHVVNTFGGSTDSVASVQIQEAGTFNQSGQAPPSASGTMLNRVTFSTVVLANSDLLRLELFTEVGTR